MKVDSFPIAIHVFVSLSTHQKGDVTQIPPLGMANKYPQTSRVIKIKCSLKKETANGYCWTKHLGQWVTMSVTQCGKHLPD